MGYQRRVHGDFGPVFTFDSSERAERNKLFEMAELGLKKKEVDAIEFAFDVYDFKGDGKVDAFYAGDLIRACNLNPTLIPLLRSVVDRPREPSSWARLTSSPCTRPARTPRTRVASTASWSSNLSWRGCALLRSKFVQCSLTCIVQYSTVLCCTTIQYSTIQYCTKVTGQTVLLLTFLRVETLKPSICLHSTVLYSTTRQCCIPAQYSPWGHLAAEIDGCRQFLCPLTRLNFRSSQRIYCLQSVTPRVGQRSRGNSNTHFVITAILVQYSNQLFNAVTWPPHHCHPTLGGLSIFSL